MRIIVVVVIFVFFFFFPFFLNIYIYTYTRKTYSIGTMNLLGLDIRKQCELGDFTQFSIIIHDHCRIEYVFIEI